LNSLSDLFLGSNKIEEIPKEIGQLINLDYLNLRDNQITSIPKQIDQLVISLGFSGSGINFLLYLTIIILFYLVFKLRLSLAKTESSITKLARQIALSNTTQKKE
jgi:Leucine-rich repeat (LRR) protein